MSKEGQAVAFQHPTRQTGTQRMLKQSRIAILEWDRHCNTLRGCAHSFPPHWFPYFSMRTAREALLHKSREMPQLEARVLDMGSREENAYLAT
jgi:hypothetical protein